MTVNVLLTGTGGLMAHFILKALKATDLDVRIIGCDHGPNSAGLFQTHVGYVVPSARDEKYLPKILEICRRERIQVILVHGAVERQVLAGEKEVILAETGAVVITPPPEVLRRVEDKWELTRYLDRAGFDFPRSVVPENHEEFVKFLDEVRFPYVIKDRFGCGSKGLGIARDKRELDHFVDMIPTPVIQEYLSPDDEEYTVGVFVEPNGRTAASIVMKRELGLGMTMKAQVLPDSSLGTYCEKVVQGTGCMGPTNVQLRLTQRGPVVFEINARFSTTTSARCHFGYNEADMSIRAFVLHESIERPSIHGGRFFRFIEDIFIDEERLDLLSREGRIENVGRNVDPVVQRR